MGKNWFGTLALVCGALGLLPAAEAATDPRSAHAENHVHLAHAVDHVRFTHAALVAREAPPAPKLESARAQLDHADGLRRALRGLEDTARKDAQLRAAAAYRAVREHFPGDAGACAEAAYRGAELVRQAGELDAARAEYAVARERGAGTPWRVRAALELGHLERRAKRSAPALAAYEAVIADASASPGQRDDASLWSGRVLADDGRTEDAVRVWTRVADHGDDPLDRIRGYDYWAQELVEQTDLEGAAGVLERCRSQLAEAAQEESRLGERLRAALAGMRAIEVLARAVEKRERSPR
jgi:tetratricopeptide (TPR) repeat protein